MFRCFVVASPHAVLMIPEFESCVVLQAYTSKNVMQANDYIQILNGQMSAAYCVADCSSLPAVVCAPPAVVGNSSTS